MLRGSGDDFVHALETGPEKGRGGMPAKLVLGLANMRLSPVQPNF
jgi:hypothetical protein